jgi:hypothetical protein
LSLNQERISLWVGCLALIGAVVIQTKASLKWGHGSWQITEWLINYQGGFVRRGLPGQVILYISDFLGIHANYIAIFVSLLVYIFLVIYLLIKTRHKFAALLIISPIVMGAPAYQDFIIRKDVLGIIFFLVCLKILFSKKKNILKYFSLNLVAIIALLSHEAFFFFAIPAMGFIIFQSDSRPNDSLFEKISYVLAVLSPSLLAFCICVVHKGDPIIAHAINLSWIDLWKSIEPNSCCFDKPKAAIDAIQWTTKQGLSLSYSLLFAFSMGIYVPLAWLVTIIMCSFFILSFSIKLENAEYKNILSILIFQLIMIAPLFILGWDFGRWIFLWSASAIILYISGVKFGSPFDFAINACTKKLIKSRIHIYFSKNGWLLLIFGIPVCCWSISQFIGSSPIGFYLKYPLRLLKNLI